MSATEPQPPIEFAPPASLGWRSQVRAVLELLRLPNVFTAVADVLLGYLFTHAELAPWPLVALLVGSSALIYSAGMVLNDYFDRALDAVERPGRPLPSGRASTTFAHRFGFALLLAGVSLGCGAAGLSGEGRPAMVAIVLAALVVAYDAAIKSTPLAPLAMGGCRFLNVLLGMSLAPGEWQPVNWLVAAGIGVYIAGVTWFARTEAKVSSRPQLAAATAVMLAGLGLLALIPNFANGQEPLPIQSRNSWLPFWGLMAGMLAWRCGLAIAEPRPPIVQNAVRNCIFSLIILDAGACFAVQDAGQVVVVLAMLAPTMLLGRFLYST